MFNLPLLLAQEAVQSVPENVFFGLEGEERFIVILTVIGCATAVLIVIALTICSAMGSIHRRSAEYNLKRDMLDRGMSAEEIAQIIESAAPPEDATERWIASWGKSKS
jgi:hypothetical protein